MTVGIAWRERGRTYLGADRRISWDNAKAKSTTPKIFSNGPHTFSFAGHASAAQCWEYATLPAPPAPKDLPPWMQRALFPALRKALDAASLELDGEFIYCPPGSAPVVVEGWQLNHMAPCIVGSGGAYALAAHRALTGLKLTPEARLRRCLDAALIDPACGDGFDVRVLR